MAADFCWIKPRWYTFQSPKLMTFNYLLKCYCEQFGIRISATLDSRAKKMCAYVLYLEWRWLLVLCDSFLMYYMYRLKRAAHICPIKHSRFTTSLMRSHLSRSSSALLLQCSDQKNNKNVFFLFFGKKSTLRKIKYTSKKQQTKNNRLRERDKKKPHKIKINMTVVDCTHYPYRVITSISLLFFDFAVVVVVVVVVVCCRCCCPWIVRFFWLVSFFVTADETNTIVLISRTLL